MGHERRPNRRFAHRDRQLVAARWARRPAPLLMAEGVSARIRD